MRKGIDGFSGERLRSALAARAMSQGDLATEVGVKPGAVSNWVREAQTPEHAVALRIAQSLGVELSWLVRPFVETEGSTKLYRSNATALATARAQMGARHEWSKELALSLEQFVEFNDVDLPDPGFSDPTRITDDDIEAAAIECRERWKLGDLPIADVVLALENAGVIVVREDLGIEKIEGVSSWCDASRRPFVYLSAAKGNAVRSRFDASHELGHLILHRHISSDLATEHYRHMENQAHIFAGAFLLPRSSFYVGRERTPSIDTLVSIKLRWKVSVAAMIKRLEHLGRLTDRSKLNMWKLLSARGWRRGEPFDDSLEVEHPRLLRRAITLLVDEKVMTRERIPEVLGPSAKDIAQLVGLPSNYFTATPEQRESRTPVRLR